MLGCAIGTVLSRLHNARKRLKTLRGPMLGLFLWLGACLFGSVRVADAQTIIRFGVRVLQASNVPGPEGPPPPGLRHRPPGPGMAPAPPPPPPGQHPLAPAPPPGGAAGNEGEDERLKRILPQLRMVFRYNDYTTLEHYSVNGPLGTPKRFSIPGERWLEVTPDEMQSRRVRMQVRLFKGDRSEMNASIIVAPGAPAVLGGPAHGNGVLIIILWANPNPPPGP